MYALSADPTDDRVVERGMAALPPCLTDRLQRCVENHDVTAMPRCQDVLDAMATDQQRMYDVFDSLPWCPAPRSPLAYGMVALASGLAVFVFLKH